MPQQTNPKLAKAACLFNECRKSGGCENTDRWCHRPADPDDPYDPRRAFAKQEEAAEPRADGLLPCPFCGAKAVLTNVRMSGYTFKVGCYNETCWRPGTDGFDSEKVAIEAWNKRIPPPDDVCPVSPQELRGVADHLDYLGLWGLWGLGDKVRTVAAWLERGRV
jgi:hypothetical protein